MSENVEHGWILQLNMKSVGIASEGGRFKIKEDLEESNFGRSLTFQWKQ